jgi:hypothetical protein
MTQDIIVRKGIDSHFHNFYQNKIRTNYSSFDERISSYRNELFFIKNKIWFSLSFIYSKNKINFDKK